jgi:predicted AAA+ superfamily ATPase
MFMFKKDISKINVKDLKKRDVFSKVFDFVMGDECLNGKILVLYGLRRTGKTTIMEQVINAYPNPDECTMCEMEDGDSMEDIKYLLAEEKKNGKKIIFLDEITKTENFINRCAVLPDLFAKEGMKIVVAGTDSLGLLLAENGELYDRMIKVSTTHITFAEHCRVLGGNDIDDYIRYGGLMREGAKGAVYSYETAIKYLDSAVSENISNSLKKDRRDSSLDVFTADEIKTIIEKMVEIYSGEINIRDAQEELSKASVNYPLHKLKDLTNDSDKEIIEKIYFNEKDIINDFAKKINADISIKHEVTGDMLAKLEQYLMEMDLLSVVKEKEYRKQRNFDDYIESGTKYEYYIIQPALKYYHLLEGKKFIEEGNYYNDLSAVQKEFMTNKLDEKIKGDMIEQIIAFDTSSILPNDRYNVLKTKFYENGSNKGEYDMLIYDKKGTRYWGFEIKHTENPYKMQDKHLRNDDFARVMNSYYGNREKACVLYRGKSFITNMGTVYLNITDFMLAIDKHRDMDKTMEELTKELEVWDINRP